MSEKGFETTLSELEQCVRELESGELSLERSLELFEQGVALARSCHEHLDAAEQRIVALRRGGAGVEEQPLPEPE